MTTSQRRYPKPFPESESPTWPDWPADPQSPESSSTRPPAPPPPPPNRPPQWEDPRQLPTPPHYAVPPPQFGRIPHNHNQSVRRPDSTPCDPGRLAVPSPPSPAIARAAALPGPLANFGSRTVSFCIDCVAPVTVLIALLAVAAHTNGTGWRLVISAWAYLGLLGFGIWNSGYLQGTTGRSVGRRVAATKLISIETGQPVGFGWAVARQIWHVVDFGVGFLWPLRDSKRQTFADKIVGTVVVNVGKPTTGHVGEPMTDVSGEVSGIEDRRLGK
jgi:uncharacterized RDD family membrane protein YckC